MLAGLVGIMADNLASDVVAVQRALNRYVAKLGLSTLIEDGRCGAKTVDAIRLFQRSAFSTVRPDGIVTPQGPTARALGFLSIVAPAQTTQVLTKVITKSEGKLTWDAEGQEGGPYHSRKLHVPSASSGLTIGRGYDMKERTKSGILTDLVACGVSQDDAAKLAESPRLSGQQARDFIVKNKLENFEISKQSQELLFKSVYRQMLNDVQRISQKEDVVKLYGKLNFDAVSGTIIDVLVDLRFRGDYTGTSRAHVQKPAVQNDMSAFRAVIGNRAFWANVPADRFDRRVKYLAISEKKDV